LGLGCHVAPNLGVTGSKLVVGRTGLLTVGWEPCELSDRSSLGRQYPVAAPGRPPGLRSRLGPLLPYTGGGHASRRGLPGASRA